MLSELPGLVSGNNIPHRLSLVRKGHPHCVITQAGFCDCNFCKKGYNGIFDLLYYSVLDGSYLKS